MKSCSTEKTRTKTTVKVLDHRTWLSDQTWHDEMIFAADGRVVRVQINRNAYDFQSEEIGSLFDGDRWNVLVSRSLAPSLKTISYVRPTLTEAEVAGLEKESLVILALIRDMLDHHDI